MSLKSVPKNIAGKFILLRIDVNSALDKKSNPIDSPRFKRHSDFLLKLLKRKARVVIISHQGRKGKKDYLPSMEKHAKMLGRHIKRKIEYVDDLFGERAGERIIKLKAGEAVLLENARNYDDDNIGKMERNYESLCSLCDFFVNDAFSVCHRNQASVVLPARFLRSFAGDNLYAELRALDKFMHDKSGNTAYLLGGEKLEDYFPLFKVLENPNVKILASGVLANAFLIANGHNLGYENIWMKEKGYSSFFPKLRKIFDKHSRQIVLPLDFVPGESNPAKTKARKEINFSDFPINKKIWDVGHKTSALFKKHIKMSDRAFMKGPLGFSEIPKFSYATVDVLKCISELTKKKKIFSLLGGGHLTTSIKEYNIPDNFSHTCLSGGAAVLYLAGKKLPGLEALKKSAEILT